MELEDFRSLCYREQLKALNFVSEAQYLKAHYEQEYANNQQNLDAQKAHLNTLIDEKLEQVSIVELTIKQRIEQLNERTRKLKEEKQSFDKYKAQSLKEIAEEKAVVQEEL